MKHQRHIIPMIKLAHRISRQRGLNKYFMVIYGFSGIALLFLTLTAIFMQSLTLASLIVPALYIIAFIGAIGIILQIRDVVKQIRREKLPFDGVEEVFLFTAMYNDLLKIANSIRISK